MAHAVTVSPRCRQGSVEGFDRASARRVMAKVITLAEVSRPPGTVKLAGQSDLYRLRVGA